MFSWTSTMRLMPAPTRTELATHEPYSRASILAIGGPEDFQRRAEHSTSTCFGALM